MTALEKSKIIVSNRLICDLCHKTVCYYSYTHSERTVMNEIKDVLCQKCYNKGKWSN